MKKTIPGIIILTVLVSSSCKKDRTCECTTTSSYKNSHGQVTIIGSGSDNTTTTSSTAYKDMKKSDMKSLCSDGIYINTSTTTNPDGSITTITQTNDTKCTLK